MLYLLLLLSIFLGPLLAQAWAARLPKSWQLKYNGQSTHTGIAELLQSSVPTCIAPPDAACAERYNTYAGQMSWPDRRLDLSRI